jgi:hypothetical protein
MNEKVIQVLKTMAVGKLADYDGSIYCLYCDGTVFFNMYTQKFPDEITFVHKSACPIALAREALIAIGLPPNIYRLNFELYRKYQMKGNDWIEVEQYTVAVTEEDARATIVLEFGIVNMRDIHIVLRGKYEKFCHTQ